MDKSIINIFYKEQMKKKATTDKYKLNRLKEEINKIIEVRELTKEDMLKFMEKYEVGMHDLQFIINKIKEK